MWQKFQWVVVAFVFLVPSYVFAAVPFGGALTQPIEFCNDGSIYVEALSTPTPGNYMWAPGTLSYTFGPPAFVSQWLLGIFSVPRVCVQGNSIRGVGMQIIFHGSSGAGTTPVPPPPQAAQPYRPPSDDSCQFSQMSTDTPAGKRAAEDQARLELGACNIQVRSSQTNGAPCGFGQNGLDGGCTDVSGLQCGAVRELCAIAQKCPLSITGGSEAGHQGHKSGREIDVAADPACIARNFSPIDNTGCRYRDPATGTTFRNEAVCRAERTTGPHFHLCIGGNC